MTSLRRMFPWAVLFTLATSQAPLFTSNQNQYFLQGLARAGFGTLQQDWLVGTLDPTPVFSVFVYGTYALTRWPTLYYLIFAVLAGTYFIILARIIFLALRIDPAPLQRGIFYTLIIALHAEAVRVQFTRWFGVEWDYLFDGGFAGQRILGPVLQPSAFGVFLLVSIYLYLKERRGWAVAAAVAAATIHPTYLLSAAVLVLVYMWEEVRDKVNSASMWNAMKLGGGALLGVMPILIYAYVVFSPTTAEATKKARNILVNVRIPHHAVPAEWFGWPDVVRIAFIIAALYLARRTKLFPVMAAVAGIGAVLTAVQIISDSNTLALIFPWRMSVFLAPLSVSLVSVWGAATLLKGVPNLLGWANVAGTVLSVGLAIAGGVKFILINDIRTNAPERAMMTFAAENHEPEDVFLTPTKMQDFRLAAKASAYVDFKSIPYKDIEVLEWDRRVKLAKAFYEPGDGIGVCAAAALLTNEGVTKFVVPAEMGVLGCEGMETVYRDDYFSIAATKK